MAHPLQTLVQQLGRAAARNGLSQLADAELLRRFKTDRDRLAFEAIIWRHGMMVLGVCRRVLGERGDAEDAFQGTFLALVRFAPSVRSGESLAGWLYRVARRHSIRASGRTERQVHRESRAARAEAVFDDDFDRSELRAILDREIERLPSRNREAFILCHLEGRAHEDAARELNCPLGTLHSRLARAKERLRARLGVHGELVPVVATLLVSPQLVNATVSAAIKLANGSVLATVASAVAISFGGRNLMGFINAKCIAAAVIAVATICSGAVFLHRPAASATSEPAALAPAEPTIEELKRENQRLRQEVASLKKRLAEFDGQPLLSAEAPSEREVLRALRNEVKGQLSEIEIVTEKMVDQLGPVRVYPLVGIGQVRSQHWKCTVYYLESDAKEAKNADGSKKTKRVQVVYIDKNSFVTAADQAK
jgi:RNA polymerase sigma factor (sigma-70 family)